MPLKEWYAASELAGLPGLPGTKRAIQIRAKNNNWQSRPRAGRGGGREYHISVLPRETQGHLHHQHAMVRLARQAKDAVKEIAEAAAERRERPSWAVRLFARLLRPVIREVLRRERKQ